MTPFSLRPESLMLLEVLGSHHQGPAPGTSLSGREELSLLGVYDPQGETTPYPGWQTDPGRVTDKRNRGKGPWCVLQVDKECFHLCQEALGVLH